MTRNVVNLDALLPRQNLSSPAEATADIEGFKLHDLQPGLTYAFLRKPDFQRETANWSPDQVADLIETFVKGSIIPSIVLWQSGQRVFVIDGAHRLSALIAWVRDDYGAGKLSIERYENVIPDHQKIMHDLTKKTVESKVRSYEEHLSAAQYPTTADPEVLSRATQFPFRRIDIQWIRNATPDQARDAFFRINQGGTPIDTTETRILRARDSALAISSRAIARGGTGHDYWDRFAKETQKEIEELGGGLQKLLFAPPLRPNTLDVPVAGFGYGSHILPFAFDLVLQTNRLAIPDSSRRKAPTVAESPDDLDGKSTVEYLRRARKIARLICSNDPSSLGLHPALYFYTPDGVFQSAALFNAADWFIDLESKGKLNSFLKVREAFESLILDHPVVVKPPAHKLGSGSRTRARMVSLYGRIYELLKEGKSAAEVWDTVTQEPDFLFLVQDDKEQKEKALVGTPGKRFSRKAKAASYFAQALPTAPKCPLCGGRLHTNGMVGDHKEELSKGGTSASANARMVHPICNSNRAINE
jgi:hypothetical protein